MADESETQPPKRKRGRPRIYPEGQSPSELRAARKRPPGWKPKEKRRGQPGKTGHHPPPVDQLPPNYLEIIEQMAAEGQPQAMVAKALGIGFHRFQLLFKENAEVRAAWGLGIARNEWKLSSRMQEIAMSDAKGNVLAGIFLLRAKHGWQEKQSLEVTNNVRLVTDIPMAMDAGAYRQKLEATLHPASAGQLIAGEVVDGEDVQ